MRIIINSIIIIFLIVLPGHKKAGMSTQPGLYFIQYYLKLFNEVI